MTNVLNLLTSLLFFESFYVSSSLNTLILYVFSEHGGQNAEQKANLEFFLQFGLLKNNNQSVDTYHFCFIINGNVTHNTTLLLGKTKTYSNVDIVYRENFGYDFCSWRMILTESIKLKYKMSYFMYFIMLNASVRGPFKPVYFNNVPWPFIFTNLLVDNVRLVGTTINCAGPRKRLHIQSMFVSFSYKDLNIIVQNLICNSDKGKWVIFSEIGISQAILNDKGNLAVTQLFWNKHDFLNYALTEHKCGLMGGDTTYPGAYGGLGLNPIELCFIKTTRGVSPEAIARYSEWQILSSAESILPRYNLSGKVVVSDEMITEYYVGTDGHRFPNASSSFFQKMTKVYLTATEVGQIPLQDMFLPQLEENDVIRCVDETSVYLLITGQKRAFNSKATFLSHGFSFENVKVIPELIFSNILTGPNV